MFAVFAVIVIFAALLVDGFHHISKGEIGAFATYFKAATVMRAGDSPYNAIRGYPYVYPPLWAWVCQPLALFRLDVAARVMLGINASLLAGALALSARSALQRFTGSAPLTRLLPVTLIATLLVAIQIHKELRSQQTDLILMLAFVLAIAWLDRRPRWAGVALAFAINVKYVPLIAVPYLILRRRWSVLGGLGAGIICLALLPALTVGWKTNLGYLQQSIGGLSHLTSANHSMHGPVAGSGSNEARVHGLTDKMDHSITSAIARWTTGMHLPVSVGLALDGLLALGWIALVLTRSSNGVRPMLLCPPAALQRGPIFRQRVALEWAAMMTAAMVFSPSSLLIFAIYPAALFGVLLVYAPGARRSVALVTGAALLWLALLFPFSALGSRFEEKWDAAGGSCWILLVSTTLLIYRARRYLEMWPPTGDMGSHSPILTPASVAWSAAPVMAASV